MRDILFKAKRLDNGEWVEGFLFWIIYDGVKTCCMGCEPIQANDYAEIVGKWHIVDPETVCQYTGLTDKNGKKIFENDVCLCPYIDPIFREPWSDKNDEECQVMFDFGAFIVKYEERANILLDNLASRIEVIRNIHD